MDYFKNLTTNLNKYGRYNLNNGMLGGMKWRNITVKYTLHLYGVMIQISIKPWNLVGYTSYFESVSRIFLVKGYTVILEAYGVWASKIMNIYCFKQNRSAYHHEFGDSTVGDKCHQLILKIRYIN